MFELVNSDHQEWVELHGVEVKEFKNKSYAFFPIPCTKLENGRCTIYKDRPQMCRDYECNGELDD